MTEHERRCRRQQLDQQDMDVQEIWNREIASPNGPLPGAVLEVLEYADGWVGHVQLVTRRPASDIDKAAAAIEDAYDLLVGSVVVDSSGSGAEIWAAYQRPSAARHHRRRPMSVRQRGQLDDDGLYARVWRAMREGGTVDMERFVRRLARLEAGLTDTARYARHEVLVDIVEKAGLPYESLSEDVASGIGMKRR
ncbi:hypothetical protein [Streptomyces syringium]|uniref:hypothetical protein n=1 Tax=Streptomyces syringium TaxID=76729 RepID=UPI0033D3810F